VVIRASPTKTQGVTGTHTKAEKGFKVGTLNTKRGGIEQLTTEPIEASTKDDVQKRPSPARGEKGG